MSERTKAAIRRMNEWEASASDRDIQIQLLRVAVETRDKIETIRAIATFVVILWVIGTVIGLVGFVAAGGG